MDTLVFPYAQALTRPRRRPLVMGIVNCTPDSFSGDGHRAGARDEIEARERAVGHGLKLLQDGADLLDLGGLSTRPGADDPGTEEEARRLVPVVAALRAKTRAPLSVDTFRCEVARRAIEAGADFINDVGAMREGWGEDESEATTASAAWPPMARLCAQTGAHLALMHAAGTPESGWTAAEYPNGVVAEVAAFLRRRAFLARAAGVPANRLWYDPGFGFGKSSADQARLLRGLAELEAELALERELATAPYPAEGGGASEAPDGALFPRGRILVGLSRKRWIGELTGLPVDARDEAGAALSMLAAEWGAGMLRVHDVRAARRWLDAREKILLSL